MDLNKLKKTGKIKSKIENLHEVLTQLNKQRKEAIFNRAEIYKPKCLEKFRKYFKEAGFTIQQEKDSVIASYEALTIMIKATSMSTRKHLYLKIKGPYSYKGFISIRTKRQKNVNIEHSIKDDFLNHSIEELNNEIAQLEEKADRLKKLIEDAKNSEIMYQIINKDNSLISSQSFSDFDELLKNTFSE